MEGADKILTKQTSSKIDDFSVNIENGADKILMNNQNLKINDNTNSIKAGERDSKFHGNIFLSEKNTQFEHYSIPEQIVHSGESGTKGVLNVYKSQDKFTKTNLSNDTSAETHESANVSKVIGSGNSKNLAREVNGFVAKCYTSDGNYDVVVKNMPEFVQKIL